MLCHGLYWQRTEPLSSFCPEAVEITSCLTRICEEDYVCSMTGILCKNAQQCNSLAHLLVIYFLLYFKLGNFWPHELNSVSPCRMFHAPNWAVVRNLLIRCVLKSCDALDLWRNTLVWGIYFQSQPRTFLSSGQTPKHNMHFKIEGSRSYVRKCLFHLRDFKEENLMGPSSAVWLCQFIFNCTCWQTILIAK